MSLMKLLSLSALVAFAAPLSGCFFVEDDAEPAPFRSGTLTVSYTIEETTDPNLCWYYGATDAELAVYTAAGSLVTEKHALCEDFLVSAWLTEGLYTADVTLVNHMDQAMSVTKPLYDLQVLPDRELVVGIDFPPSSMIGGAEPLEAAPLSE